MLQTFNLTVKVMEMEKKRITAEETVKKITNELITATKESTAAETKQVQAERRLEEQEAELEKEAEKREETATRKIEKLERELKEVQGKRDADRRRQVCSALLHQETFMSIFHIGVDTNLEAGCY